MRVNTIKYFLKFLFVIGCLIEHLIFEGIISWFLLVLVGGLGLGILFKAVKFFLLSWGV
jgi:hypothetical protein